MTTNIQHTGIQHTGLSAITKYQEVINEKLDKILEHLSESDEVLMVICNQIGHTRKEIMNLARNHICKTCKYIQLTSHDPTSAKYECYIDGNEIYSGSLCKFHPSKWQPKSTSTTESEITPFKQEISEIIKTALLSSGYYPKENPTKEHKLDLSVDREYSTITQTMDIILTLREKENKENTEHDHTHRF